MIDPEVEVEFRDQTRWMPRYVADQLPDEDTTFTMTYLEAMAWINRRQVADLVNDVQQKLINHHFRVQNERG